VVARARGSSLPASADEISSKETKVREQKEEEHIISDGVEDWGTGPEEALILTQPLSRANLLCGC
jgi:hypothetical protein